MRRATITVDGSNVPEDGTLETVFERARATVATWRFGVELMRKNLRIANPGLSCAEIEARLQQWLEGDE